ncbi:hypothetical protein BS50DRAFT_350739 [Corynespora cassiicola Philippines]|uniref:Uncharacterized protein n=1 Tax=Corynespora cassiicola Philippines TaxID=1448308 RepID=A0A2T2NQZ3_CORCC|nr:hypothetical protein BS50DRAFT_350739 [Corynespora cassiicola Philippines]
MIASLSRKCHRVHLTGHGNGLLACESAAPLSWTAAVPLPPARSPHGCPAGMLRFMPCPQRAAEFLTRWPRHTIMACRGGSREGHAYRPEVRYRYRFIDYRAMADGGALRSGVLASEGVGYARYGTYLIGRGCW